MNLNNVFRVECQNLEGTEKFPSEIKSVWGMRAIKMQISTAQYELDCVNEIWNSLWNKHKLPTGLFENVTFLTMQMLLYYS